MAEEGSSGVERTAGGQRIRRDGLSENKRAAFLGALTETCNVAAAAAAAGASASAFYRLRERDAAFDAAWKGALDRGYEAIEGQLIAVTRDGPDGTFDPRLAMQVLGQRNAREAKGGAIRRATRVKHVPIAEVDAQITRKLKAIARRLGTCL